MYELSKDALVEEARRKHPGFILACRRLFPNHRLSFQQVCLSVSVRSV